MEAKNKKCQDGNLDVFEGSVVSELELIGGIVVVIMQSQSLKKTIILE
jgi:hypothetical protein